MLNRTEEEFCRSISISSSTGYVREIMCKMSSILLVVASIFVLVAGDCMQKIKDIESQTKDRPFIGGYRSMEDPKNDAVAVNIVADAIKSYNNGSNDELLYVDDDHYKAYRQLVNGHKYCCVFQVKSDGCKKGGNGKDCRKETKQTCTAEAYKAFTDKFATIKPESVQCTNVVEP